MVNYYFFFSIFFLKKYFKNNNYCKKSSSTRSDSAHITRTMYLRQTKLLRRFATEANKTIDTFFAAGPTWSLRELSDTTTVDSSTSKTVHLGDLDKLADLAHLDIPLERRSEVLNDLKSVLQMVSLVEEGATKYTETCREGIPPIVDRTRLRLDVVTEHDLSMELLNNAKNTESGYFVVPNVQEST